MNISIIPPAVLDIVVKDAERMLMPALERSNGRFDFKSVLAMIETGHNQLWFAFDTENNPVGALVTVIEQYPLRKMLNLLFCGGTDLEDWHEEMLDILEAYGRKHGCDGMELVGRYGWKPFLEKFGWEASYLVCQRTFEIEEEQKEVA